MRDLILFVLVTCGLVWGAALILGDPVEGNRNLAEGLRSLGLTLPGHSGESQSPENAAKEVGYSTAPPTSDRFVSFLGKKVALRFKSVSALAALHGSVALELLPIAILVLAAGLTAGLARREGLRNGSRFASPIWSWMGKRVAIFGMACSLVFALTPLVLPWWTLWAGVVVASGGTGIYVSNLPLKL